jgi:uncharacterized protein
MKILSFILFFAVFFSIYAAGNFYVYVRGLQAMPHFSWLRWIYTSIFTLFFLALFIARFIDHTFPHVLSVLFSYIGYFWMVALLYFFLLILVIDIVRIANYFLPFYPVFIVDNYAKTKLIILILSSSAISLLLIAGHLNAISPKLRKYDLLAESTSLKSDSIRIAVATDLHAGIMVGTDRLKKLTSTINSQKPDIILLAGDLVDEVLSPVVKYDLAAELRNLHAPMGVYAVPGNHEYIGGIDRALTYIKSLNIKVLRDSTIKIDDRLWLVGRDDRSGSGFSGQKRKNLDDLLSPTDSSLPIILMDHQPFHLEEAAAKNVSLQVSGHTHDGQFWPFSLITSRMYELSCGYKKKGNTHFIVSSGFGTWGPPVRVGTTPEILLITLKTKHQ